LARSTSSNDDVTGKRLRLLIGLVVVLGVAVVATAVTRLIGSGDDLPDPVVLALLVAGIAVASRTTVSIRVRANLIGVSWTELAVIVGLILVPAPWVVLCTALGITVSKVSGRVPAQRALFGVAKEILVTATAAAVFTVGGYRADPTEVSLDAVMIAIAVVAMWIVDEALTLPVMALATRTPIRRMISFNAQLRVVTLLARYLVTVLVIGILSLEKDPRLLLVVPPVVLCIHLWQAGHLRSQAERDSWQRLAQTTDELNDVDLTAVLHVAATRAAQLVTADEAEIELRTDDRLVRSTPEDVSHDGPTGAAPARGGNVITAQLAGQDDSGPIGELRIRFLGTVRLTKSETYKIQTFAAALSTAIRNAKAYAELKRISEENAHAATHDALTGLANRRELLDQAGKFFTERLDEGMLALLLIDLNHFKEVNDTLGHSAGDKVLREVAHRLEAASRPDDLVARLGGDEFAILLTGLPTPAIATHRAESLLAALDRTIEVDGMHLTVEACGGIAIAPGAGGVTELLRRADVAMYQAKRSGQRTATYVHSRDTADVGRLVLGGELRRAVAEHEFVVDFQPIVDLGSGEVVSAEALARWHHPEHGNLTPMRFLETIERSGQLPAFADAVLEQSLAAVGTWREAGFDLPVAVNVSPRSLLDPQFPAAVLARLASHGVAPDRLVLELAETLTIGRLEVVERSLAELRDAGVRLALDDFGTGVSSLSVLSRLPVHQLKIDREVVGAVETSSEAAALVRSTVDLARSLHLTVVAEGVESEPQRHALWEAGCVSGQGHLFARPMRAGRMLAALQRGSGGRPGVLADALHDAGSVIRMPRRRSPGPGRSSLPHLPA
jgi:diguanylate cyclase (GGDEF)-like protein